MIEMWNGLSTKSRIGLGVGCAMIVGLMVAIAVWAYRTEYQVLFSDLAARDAAAMTAELDKTKTPYLLDEGGTTILVPKELVYKTRLTLMGTEVPLHGAVGFEVFNNADFGMTEFVQKVNYLRAIQGELTRTILSIDDIQSARVHLAIPEQGLFKKAVTKPKASVTVGMKPGRGLGALQVVGIQRLVAASVPDIQSADVTVLDQQGVALTRVSGTDGGAEQAGSQLDTKRSTEEYLAKKVGQVLDSTFGAGEAIASVDVALNLNHGKVTTEEVLAAKDSGAEGAPTGVVVRERLVVREDGTGGKPATGAGNTSTESDYQVGRRVEQMAIAGGTVRRMTIAVVVKRPMSGLQLERLKEVVALAAGFNAQRGDAIVVHTMESLVNDNSAAGAVATDVASTAAQPGHATVARTTRAPDPESAMVVMWVLGALAIALVVGAAAYLGTRRRSQARPSLGTAERERMLLEVRQWIGTPPLADNLEGGHK